MDVFVTVTRGSDEARFKLVKGKLHIPTIARRFGLDPATVRLDGAIPAARDDGFTYEKFMPMTRLTVCGKSGVSHQGRLAEDVLCFDVLMEFGDNKLAGTLLIDGTSSKPLLMSEHTANQLGLPSRDAAAKLEASNGCTRRRDVLLTKLLMVGEPEDVLDEPMRSAHLELWVHGDAAGDTPSDGGTAAADPVVASSAPHGSFLKLTLRSAREGYASSGCDAVLGSMGMAQLRLGINRESGNLYIEERKGYRRIGKRVARDAHGNPLVYRS